MTSIVGIESLQHAVIKHREIVDPSTEVEKQPNDHDGCEGACNFRRSERLNGEE